MKRPKLVDGGSSKLPLVRGGEKTRSVRISIDFHTTDIAARQLDENVIASLDHCDSQV